MARYLKRFSLIALFIALNGCSSISYYQQAISGHLSVIHQRQPIEHYLAAPTTPERLRRQLKKVTALRLFAEQELALPIKGQYDSYADLERPYVVWNVFAAPELSLQAKTWCYLIVGCASYRGYYSQQEAHHYASQLEHQGLDVYVAGIAAYSTLGWFNDPLLNTFIYRSDTQLANLIFHELAHQLLYVKGDSVFNESLATVIANEGVKRWLQSQDNPASYERFLQNNQREQAFVKLVLSYREQLTNLYQSNLNDTHKRTGKTRIINNLRAAHQQLKEQWSNQSSYDSWFAKELNNAQLNTVATYFDLVPAFEVLLAENGYNLDTFYQACQTLAEQPIAERNQQLNKLIPVQRTVHPQTTTF